MWVLGGGDVLQRGVITAEGNWPGAYFVQALSPTCRPLALCSYGVGGRISHRNCEWRHTHKDNKWISYAQGCWLGQATRGKCQTVDSTHWNRLNIERSLGRAFRWQKCSPIDYVQQVQFLVSLVYYPQDNLSSCIAFNNMYTQTKVPVCCTISCAWTTITNDTIDQR